MCRSDEIQTQIWIFKQKQASALRWLITLGSMTGEGYPELLPVDPG